MKCNLLLQICVAQVAKHRLMCFLCNAIMLMRSVKDLNEATQLRNTLSQLQAPFGAALAPLTCFE